MYNYRFVGLSLLYSVNDGKTNQTKKKTKIMSNISVSNLMTKTNRPTHHEDAPKKDISKNKTEKSADIQNQDETLFQASKPPPTNAQQPVELANTQKETKNDEKNGQIKVNQNPESNQKPEQNQKPHRLSFKETYKLREQQQTFIPEIRRISPSNKSLHLNDNVREHIDQWKGKYVSWFTEARMRIPQFNDIEETDFAEIERLIESGILPTVHKLKGLSDKCEILRYLSKRTDKYDYVQLAWLYSCLFYLCRYITDPNEALLLSKILSKLITEINELSPTDNLFSHLCVNYVTISEFFHLSSYLR